MSKQNMPKLPAEAIKFAKSMGLDLNGLEPEAEDIWKMLDDMSTKDPLQYEAFVSQQFENAKEGAEKSSKTDDDKRSFRPVAGYCVETTSLSGDGLKIRDVGASKGKKFFINLCSSVVIEEPTDKTGKPIKGDRTVADGLNIPLIVGPVRPADASSAEKDKELYVDVVLHPRVIELANKEKYFKAQIVDLALDWVIQETKVECDRKWSHVTNATYKGGRGEKRDTPVLFFVDATGAPVSASPYADSAASTSAAACPTAAPSPVLSSTSSLLSQIHKEKSGQAEEATAKVDIFAATASKAGQKNTKTTTVQDKEVSQKPKVTLIQEIGAPSPKSPFAEEPVTTQKNIPAATAAAVPGGDEKKKASFSTGFLNKTSTSSTSSVSSSSAPSAKNGISKESNTISSSALLDPPAAAGVRADPFLIRPSTTAATTASTAATSGPSSNKASAPTSTAVPVSTLPTPPLSITSTSSAAPAAPAAGLSVPSIPAVKQPTKMEYHQMKQLLSSFDEEFSSASGIMNGDSTFLDTESANSMISDLAKVLGGNSSLLAATNPTTPTPAATAAAKTIATKQLATSTASSVSSGGSSAPGKKGKLEDHLVLSNDAPGVVAITAKTEQEEGAPHALLVLTITGLSSYLDTSTMELLVSSNEVIVKVDKQYLTSSPPSPATITHNNKMASFGARFDSSTGVGILQEHTAAAGFKKKKGVLTVKIQYS